MELRVGQGIDVHQFVDGRPLILGGVTIPQDRGLLGHSDADALLHSITDAILGAAGLGDIGTYFPDHDPDYKDADSKVLLQKVFNLIRNQGWKIINIDSTVMTESPKLNPYIREIKSSIAHLLEVKLDACNVKATTCEKMGFIGRKDGLMAMAVVLLHKDSDEI